MPTVQHWQLQRRLATMKYCRGCCECTRAPTLKVSHAPLCFIGISLHQHLAPPLLPLPPPQNQQQLFN